MIRLPLSFTAEYRGVAPSGEFRNDAGEQIAYGEKLKFEVELPNGDVSIVPVSAKALDRATPPIDWKSLKKGDVVELAGVVAVEYFSPHSAVRAAGEKPLRAAS